MYKKSHSMFLVACLAIALLVPVVVTEARERGERSHSYDRDRITVDSTPPPVPIIIPKETLEEWKENIKEGNIEKVIEDFKDIVEGVSSENSEEGDEGEGSGEEIDGAGNEDDRAARHRDRVIVRDRGGETEEDTTSEGDVTEEEVAGEENESEAKALTYLELVAEEIHRLTNVLREEAGFPVFTFDPLLGNIARGHSEWMAENNIFSHTDLEGCSLSCRLENAEYEASQWGENIAWRSSSVLPSVEELARMFVESWGASSGHRANLLSEVFTHTGVGLAHIGSKIFVTVDFAKPQ